MTFHTENHAICDSLNYVSTKKEEETKKETAEKYTAT